MCATTIDASPSTLIPDYDAIAPVYDLWASGDPASAACWEFYRHEVARRGGVCLEVGVGTGAVLLGAGEGPEHYHGVEMSRRMIDELEKKLQRSARPGFPYTLIHGDIMGVRPPVPRPSLAIIPFRTIGHFIGAEAKVALLRRLREICAPGAICLLDHYKFNPTWARQHDRIPRWMAKGRVAEEMAVLTDTYAYDFSRQEMNCLLGVEWLAEDATVIRKQCLNFRFSWLRDDELRGLAEAAGWSVARLWGSFDYAEYCEESLNQIWELRAV